MTKVSSKELMTALSKVYQEEGVQKEQYFKEGFFALAQELDKTDNPYLLAPKIENLVNQYVLTHSLKVPDSMIELIKMLQIIKALLWQLLY